MLRKPGLCIIKERGKNRREEQETWRRVRHVPCHLGQGLGLGLHSKSMPITPKLLQLGAGALSPAWKPRELPGKQGEAEAPLWPEQMAEGRLRAEQKAPSQIVSPIHQTRV